MVDGFWPVGTGPTSLRQRHAEKAVAFITRSEESNPEPEAHAMNMAVLALARHRLKNHKEARTALDEPSRLVSRLKTDHDRQIAEVLLREAAAMIEGEK